MKNIQLDIILGVEYRFYLQLLNNRISVRLCWVPYIFNSTNNT
jgi:hypothetical protein